MSKWTQFWDMHSGGGTAEPPYNHIFIELPKDKACIYFYNRFGHSPWRVSCTCCGADYSIEQFDSLEDATEYHRTTHRISAGQHIPLEDFLQRDDVLVIREPEIDLGMCEGEVPEEGYIWIGDDDE